MQGKRVLVVGGGSGIGQAVADQALNAGATVVLAGRTPARLAESVRTLLAPGAGDVSRAQRVSAAVLDARDESALERFMAEHARDGLFDHVVVTVGPGATTQRYAGFLSQPTEDAHALFDNKFWAQYLCAKTAAPHVAPGGSITLFGGGAARKPQPAMAVLAAVQAAIEGLVRGMALDLAPLRVNAVAPGRIATSSFADMPAAAREAMLAQWAASLPVGRIGQPGDAAAAALYLMGNGYTTGHVLYVDGGHYLR